MNKSFAIPFLAIVFSACSNQPGLAPVEPYKFNRDKLDSMVKTKSVIYDAVKRPDGTLKSETFYLGDTAKYRLDYSEKSVLMRVMKYDIHGQVSWVEFYHENGQRQSHYPYKAFEVLGPESVKHGIFHEYYPDGRVKTVGEYNKRDLLWVLEYSKTGQPGDTTVYEYDPAPVVDTTHKKKPKVEKINTATTPN